MTEEEFEVLNRSHLMLLAIGTRIIFQEIISEEERAWWVHAIEEVVYRNNPIPPGSKNKLGLNG